MSGPAPDFVELAEDVSASPLWNPDLAPTRLEQRTWSTYHIAALWIGMAVVITTYTLASGLMQQGMAWWQALGTIMLGCGTVQVCTAAMLDHAIGPNVIKALNAGMAAFFEKHADKGWHSLDDVRGCRRDRVVTHSQIKRPDTKEYFGGHEGARSDADQEGYAQQVASGG